MATWQHLRSSTAHKRPTTSLADGRIAINTNTASPGLFFKDSAGTGIVKVGPVHVGTTAPNSSPAAGGSSGNYLGEEWLDTSLTPAQLKVWNGSSWVGVVADELPVSKLQDGEARQLLQTDAAGTGVEWTSNVDVPGTLDVTSTATFDSIAQHPVGSATAPTITFTGDTNTGIYSPGADQLALSTNGTGRLFVDSSGKIGIGTNSPAWNLHIASATNTFQTITSSTTTDAGLLLGDTDSSARGQVRYANTTDSMLLYTAGSEKLRITSAGLVGIGTSAPNTLLHLASATGSATPTPTELRLATTSVGSDWSTTNPWGKISFYSADNSRTHGEINLTSVNSTGAASVMSFSILDGFPNSLREQLRFVPSGTNLTETVFSTSGTERARIDSSGRLLVGTSSAQTGYGFTPQFQIFGSNPSAASSLIEGIGTAVYPTYSRTNTGNTAVAANDTIFQLRAYGFDGAARVRAAVIECAIDGTPGTNDMPGRLVLSTTPDGSATPVERMRIKSSGIINFSNAPVYADNTAALAGGLVAGDVYRKSDGTLMITY